MIDETIIFIFRFSNISFYHDVSIEFDKIMCASKFSEVYLLTINFLNLSAIRAPIYCQDIYIKLLY